MEDKQLNQTIFVMVPFGYGVHKFKIMKRINWGLSIILSYKLLPQARQRLTNSLERLAFLGNL